MKTRLLFAPALFLTLILLIIPGCSPQAEGFAIYLTKDNIPVAQMEALSHVEIAEEPVISSKDIVAYKEDTHEIKLTAEAYERVMQLEVPTSGKSFVVCVDKGPIYWGAFWTALSSQSFDGVTIMVFPFSPPRDSIMIELGYPEPSLYQGEDPRSNPLIFESLEEAGKLQ